MESVLSQEQIELLVRVVARQPRERWPLFSNRRPHLKKVVEEKLGVELTVPVVAEAVVRSDGRLYSNGTSIWTAAVEQARKDRAKAASERSRLRRLELQAEVRKRTKG